MKQAVALNEETNCVIDYITDAKVSNIILLTCLKIDTTLFKFLIIRLALKCL